MQMFFLAFYMPALLPPHAAIYANLSINQLKTELQFVYNGRKVSVLSSSFFYVFHVFVFCIYCLLYFVINLHQIPHIFIHINTLSTHTHSYIHNKLSLKYTKDLKKQNHFQFMNLTLSHDEPFSL